MKKSFSFLLIFIFFSKNLSAQQEEDVVKKGDNIINFYYGVSVIGSLYKSIATYNPIDLKVQTKGPFGIVFEHLMSKRLGLGAEIGYTEFTLSYTTTEYLVDGTTPFQAQLTFKVLRAMFRANFHFLNTEKFDGYGFIAAGYKGTTYAYSSNDPRDPGLKLRGFVPVGFKPGVGLRYFFIKNVGINMELALGSPVFGGGLSVKF